MYILKLHLNLKLNRRLYCKKNHSLLNFDSFYSCHKYIDPNWLSWFIGFSEGDGGLHSSNGYCLFGLTQNEESILREIERVLGFGRVYYDKNVNSYRYRVSTEAENIKLAILFNGNLATKLRIEQLRNWFEILNKPLSSLNITFISNPYKPTLEDSWLSGFTDAEGSFFADEVNQKVKIKVISKDMTQEVKICKRIRIRFALCQKEESILLHINNIFNCGNVNKGKGGFQYTIGSLIGNTVTVDYFSHFLLKTKKKYAFIKWCNIRTRLLNKEHLTPLGLIKLRELIKEVNK
jgi:hypothetical protein